MKRTVFTAIAVSLMVLFVAACQLNKQEAKETDQQKQMQVTEIMKDSTKVNMLMDHIASDYNLQRMMMQKMTGEGMMQKDSMKMQKK